jgi:hypothetical protein
LGEEEVEGVMMQVYRGSGEAAFIPKVEKMLAEVINLDIAGRIGMPGKEPADGESIIPMCFRGIVAQGKFTTELFEPEFQPVFGVCRGRCPGNRIAWMILRG